MDSRTLFLQLKNEAAAAAAEKHQRQPSASDVASASSSAEDDGSSESLKSDSTSSSPTAAVRPSALLVQSPIDSTLRRAQTLQRTATASDMYKIVIVGASAVGKTSLLKRFIYPSADFAAGNTKSTIGVEYHVYKTQIDETAIDVHFWDTAGQERFAALTANYFRGAVGVIAVFDINQQQTLEMVADSMSNFIAANPSCVTSDDSPIINVPVLLLANKCDLLSKTDGDDDVGGGDNSTMEEARDWADRSKWFLFHTSAKDGTNVEWAFDAFVHAVHASVREKRTMRRTNSIMGISMGSSAGDRRSSSPALRQRVPTSETVDVAILNTRTSTIVQIPNARFVSAAPRRIDSSSPCRSRSGSVVRLSITPAPVTAPPPPVAAASIRIVPSKQQQQHQTPQRSSCCVIS